MLGAYSTVLREIPPGLAHHPDRSPINRLSVASSKKQIVRHRSTSKTKVELSFEILDQRIDQRLGRCLRGRDNFGEAR
jgi:hypothetical protein